MKRLTLVTLLMCFVLSARAQDFEGLIRWSMSMEITDAKAKAQMEEARKMASDPANQAKMKELQAQMNDPKFKAMMEQNPQMKLQMEAALKMMGGGGMESMVPKEMVIRLKDGNSLTKMTGGMFDGMEVLYLKNKNTSYQIDRDAKTYKVLPQSENDTKDHSSDVKVTKTSETKSILGHTCTKYIIEMQSPTGEGKAVSHYWATTEIKGLDMNTLSHHANEHMRGQSMFFKQAEGMPLLIDTTLPQAVVKMEAKEVTKGTQPSSQFAIPAGFKEVH